MSSGPPSYSNRGGPSPSGRTPTSVVPAVAAATLAAALPLAGMSSSLGAMSSRKKPNSASVYAGFSGAAAAPRAVMASSSSTTSGPFSQRARRGPLAGR